MSGVLRSQESSKEEVMHTFGAPIAAPLPSHRGPLLRYHGNSDELAARPIVTQPPRDPARCSWKDVQKEIRTPDPISFLLWLYLASLEKEKIVCASSPGRNLCGGRVWVVVSGLSFRCLPWQRWESYEHLSGRMWPVREGHLRSLAQWVLTQLASHTFLLKMLFIVCYWL